MSGGGLTGSSSGPSSRFRSSSSSRIAALAKVDFAMFRSPERHSRKQDSLSRCSADISQSFTVWAPSEDIHESTRFDSAAMSGASASKRACARWRPVSSCMSTRTPFAEVGTGTPYLAHCALQTFVKSLTKRCQTLDSSGIT